MSSSLGKIIRLQAVGYLAAVLGVGLVVIALLPSHGHLRMAPGLFLMLVIVTVASGWGSRPALLASAVALLALTYFFIPPYRSVGIAQPHHWFFFVAFAVTGLLVGQLSARMRARANEAERARAEVERLYGELQSAFEQASQAEALRRSEQFKSALLDCFTHDLRTPLNSIKFAATTLLRDPRLSIGEAQREMLVVVDTEADRLKKLIGDLATMARIEAGELKLRRSAAHVDHIVRETLERTRPVCPPSRIQVHIADDLPAVDADARAVAEVLYTLLENACKYAYPDTTILVSAISPAEGEVRFSVEDQGPGIPPPLRERVFNRFYRIENLAGTGDKGPALMSGSGMGLAIARGIVEAHNGRIWIEDAGARSGTRVVFTLPARALAGCGPALMLPAGTGPWN